MFKPMLAPGEDPLSYPDYFKKLKYPLLCSPKYDGIRCIVKSGRAMSRSFKMLPSNQVQNEFTDINYLDGELIEGLPTDFDVYNRTQSYVMSENKTGNLNYYVFDYTADDYLERPFYQRLEKLEALTLPISTKFVEHEYIDNYEQLIVYEEKCLSDGFEGIMMRNPLGYYKCGRGTFNEGLIYKLKRFKDAEGIILDILPMMINNNTLEKDELGYAKRSTSKDGMTIGNIAGRFVVHFEGQEIDVAPGSFNHIERRELLESRNDFIGKHLKFRYFAHGIKDKPRFPRALGLRSLLDL
jgi:DNA ligase-1